MAKETHRGHQPPTLESRPPKLQRALAANNHHCTCPGGQYQDSPDVLLKKAIEIFLEQHAMVHSAKMAKSKLWSFEDEVLNIMTHDQLRCILPNSEHSIAWILFHLARIETSP